MEGTQEGALGWAPFAGSPRISFTSETEIRTGAIACPNFLASSARFILHHYVRLVTSVVRPVALLAALVTLNFIFNSGPDIIELHKLHLVLFLILAWLGAGRCLGLDYFFYKRDRGLWW